MWFIGKGLIQIAMGGYPAYPLPQAVGAFAQHSVIAGLGRSFVFFLVTAASGDVLLAPLDSLTKYVYSRR